MDGRNPAGGSFELASLIDRYGETLLPELKHYFGIDLLEMVSDYPPRSPRYVLAHIKWLPLGSAFVAETRGGQEFRGWDQDRYMRVAQIDAQNNANWLFVMANKDPKKAALKPPDKYPIPDRRALAKSANEKPGSFGFIAKSMLADAKRKKAQRWPVPANSTDATNPPRQANSLCAAPTTGSNSEDNL